MGAMIGDRLDKTMSRLQDALKEAAQAMDEFGRAWVRANHPERCCPNCEFIADPDEQFDPCQGVGHDRGRSS